MQTMTYQGRPGFLANAGAMARRLAGPALLAGLLGGLAMIVVMILVMGAAGMGYATPLSLGMAAFVVTVTPPVSMLPTLMALMGIHLPASAAGPLMAAVHSGIVTAGVIGGAIVYVIMRWGLLPPVNPLMAFVPQLAFFLAHLLFGLAVGIVLALAFHRPSVAAALPASR